MVDYSLLCNGEKEVQVRSRFEYTGTTKPQYGNTINLVGYLNRGISEQDVETIALKMAQQYAESIDIIEDYLKQYELIYSDIT